MLIIKRWKYTKNLFAKVYINHSCFWLEDILKFSPIPTIFRGFIYFKNKNKNLN